MLLSLRSNPQTMNPYIQKSDSLMHIYSNTESSFEAQVIGCLRGNFFCYSPSSDIVSNRFISIGVMTIFGHQYFEEKSLQADIY